MRRILAFLIPLFFGTVCIFPIPLAYGFPGVYLSKSGAMLRNKTSVITASMHDGRITLNVFADYKGPDRELAVVIPIPGKADDNAASIGSSSAVMLMDLLTSPTATVHLDHTPICGSKYFAANFYNIPQYLNYEAIFDDYARRDGTKTYYQLHAPAPGNYIVSTQGFASAGELKAWFGAKGYKIPSKTASALLKFNGGGKKYAIMEASLDTASAKEYVFLKPIRMEFEGYTLPLPLSLGRMNAEEEQDVSIILLSNYDRYGAKNLKPFSFTKTPKQNHPLGGDRLDTEPIGEFPIFAQELMPRLYRALLKHAYGKKKRGFIFLERRGQLPRRNAFGMQDTVFKEEAEGLGLAWALQWHDKYKRQFGFKDETGKYYIRGTIMARFRIFPGFKPDNEDPVFAWDTKSLFTENDFYFERLMDVPGNCKDDLIRYMKLTQGERERARSNLAQLTGWSREYISSRDNDNIELAYWDLTEAVRSDDMARGKAAMEREKLLNYQYDEALILAATLGRLDFVKLLLPMVSDIKRPRSYSQTSALRAAEAGQEEVADYLLGEGVDPAVTDQCGTTMLMAASTGGLMDLVKKLANTKADLEKKNCSGKTATILALEKGKGDILKFLVMRGERLNEAIGGK